ncbi:MAG: nitrate reductase molybdenum cofactor assembly chaperone [Planctomycetes bacterium]|jgi:nitrate reductase molybdenum cofactor assembly chaperone NarJ/NarW|nr:nitrate reductase molybdenum cofactor assembly chaperone [Planctomycetota bacterium]MBT5101182.1 nitrate reductase molybdenum cofactor assembly chaperone [Planctomycetota bacterium]
MSTKARLVLVSVKTPFAFNPMRPETAVYDALAGLLAYPRAGFHESAEDWIAVVTAANSQAGEKLVAFHEMLSSKSPSELEEHYARTFDNSISGALETGWHVFGETYERGGFLVRMRQLCRECGVVESGELPDHLVHVLPVLGRTDESLALELVEEVAVPAVTKVCISLAADENPYESVLDAVLVVLNQHVQNQNGCLSS